MLGRFVGLFRLGESMSRDVLIVLLSTIPISAALTYLALKVALARGMLDIPSQRSSHAAPTPRGGGVAIVVASSAAFTFLFCVGVLDR